MDDVLTLEDQALGATNANGHVNGLPNAAPVRIEPEALELARERGMERELHELVAKAVELFLTLIKLVARVDFVPGFHEAPIVLIEAHHRVEPGGPTGDSWLEWISWKRDHFPFDVAETFMMVGVAVEGPPEN